MPSPRDAPADGRVPTAADVRAAAARLDGQVYRTPCAYSESLSALTGARVWVKLENLQMTGSFKERGALNVLAQLDPAARACGVIAASAGNHGLGLAFHAARLGVRAVVVMPEWAPLAKVSAVRRHGAEVILHGEHYDAAYARAREIEAERGLVFVHPFDDARVVAGQGTIGLELVEQCPEMAAVVAPVGGGGLLAGIALAVKHARPEVRVLGVEAAAMPAMARGLAAGSPVTIDAEATIADGLAGRRAGDLTLPLIRALADDVVAVGEEDIARAILALLEVEKTVVEGAGAVPLAALLARRLDLAGRAVVLVLSGGNIDVNLVARIIERGLVRDGRVVRLAVLVRDRPGGLARLTSLVAEARANVLHIRHDRAATRAPVGESEVALTLETAGPEHIAEVVRRLTEAGYTVDAEPSAPAP